MARLLSRLATTQRAGRLELTDGIPQHYLDRADVGGHARSRTRCLVSSAWTAPASRRRLSH